MTQKVLPRAIEAIVRDAPWMPEGIGEIDRPEDQEGCRRGADEVVCQSGTFERRKRPPGPEYALAGFELALDPGTEFVAQAIRGSAMSRASAFTAPGRTSSATLSASWLSWNDHLADPRT